MLDSSPTGPLPRGTGIRNEWRFSRVVFLPWEGGHSNVHHGNTEEFLHEKHREEWIGVGETITMIFIIDL
jgi:hypothetical protein